MSTPNYFAADLYDDAGALPTELHPGANGDQVRKHVRLTRASEIEPEPVIWAWEDKDGGRIPAGALAMAAGREGTGKSSWGIHAAAQITKGALPGSFHGSPREVFYVAVEDSWKHTLVPRLMAAGADLEKVYRFEVVTEVGDAITLSLPQDLTLLEHSIVEHRAALVVIDPLMSAIGGGIDTHNERQVRQALDPLAQVADRTGAVILGIAHFNKSAGTDAASLITGSGAFKNVPRSVFGFARDESEDDGSRVMSQVKNSLGRDDLPSLKYRIESAEVNTRSGVAFTGLFRFDGTSDRSVAEVLRDSRDGSDPEEARDAKSFIAEYLEAADGEAEAGAVIKAGKAAGFAESTLKNARRKVALTDRRGFPPEQRTVWVLKGTDTATGTSRTGDEKPVPVVPEPVRVESHEPQGATKVPKVPHSPHVTPSAPSGVEAAPSTVEARSTDGIDPDLQRVLELMPIDTPTLAKQFGWGIQKSALMIQKAQNMEAQK